MLYYYVIQERKEVKKLQRCCSIHNPNLSEIPEQAFPGIPGNREEFPGNWRKVKYSENFSLSL